MRAMTVNPSREALDAVELDDPRPGPGEVLVGIRAAGLGYADVGVRAGTFGTQPGPGAAPRIAGSEFAGEVIETGPNVTDWHPGDRVMGRGSGCAELTVVRSDHLLAVPESYTWEEAGGAPVAFLTAHDALITHGHLARNQSVIVQAAASSVGTMAVRLAATLGAGAIIATSRSQEHLDKVRELCPESVPFVAVNLATDQLIDKVHESGRGDGVDLVIDMIGAPVLGENIASLAVRGRLVQVGRLGGGNANIDLDEIARKQLTVVGVSFRTRTAADIAEMVRECATAIRPISQELRPPIHRTYPLADANHALDELSKGVHFGKIVLTP